MLTWFIKQRNFAVVALVVYPKLRKWTFQQIRVDTNPVDESEVSHS
jgi:hypothetical protein